jgi:hypothetical protein
MGTQTMLEVPLEVWDESWSWWVPEGKYEVDMPEDMLEILE